MKMSLKDIKTQIEATNVIGKIEPFSAKLTSNKRDIFIQVTYFNKEDRKQDIYPYWLIEMREEELCKTMHINGNDLKQVRDIYNGFCASFNTDKSFIETICHD